MPGKKRISCNKERRRGAGPTVAGGLDMIATSRSFNLWVCRISVSWHLAQHVVVNFGADMQESH